MTARKWTRRRLLRGVAAVGGSLATGCLVATKTARTLETADAAASSGLPGRFTVVCWNVHKDPRAVAEDLPGLADGAAIVLLQEATGLLPGWPACTMVVAFERRRDGRPAGVLTASRVPATQTTPMLSPRVEPWTRTPKSALCTSLPLAGGGELLVVNVHGLAFRPAPALAEQLDALVPILVTHRGPTIVAGDFNTYDRRRREVVERFTEPLRLSPAFPGPDRPRLDAVYARGLRVERATIHPSPHSDHDALVVAFEVVAP